MNRAGRFFRIFFTSHFLSLFPLSKVLVDKEDLIMLNANSNSLIKGFKPVTYTKEDQLGLKNIFKLMQSLFVNVGKDIGYLCSSGYLCI